MLRLTVDQKIGYSVAIATLAASLPVFLIPAEFFLWGAAAFYMVAAAVTYTVIKKRSIHSYNKRQVLLIVSVIAALYLMLYYLCGLEFGFALSPKGMVSLSSFVKKIMPLALLTVSSEILRSVLLAEKTKIVTVTSYAIGVASVIACAGGIPSFRSAYQLADFIGMALFPALTSNLLYTYLSKRYGALPNVFYRLILTLYVYLIPIQPDVPQILPAFVLLVLPLIVYTFIDMLFEKKRKMATKRESKWRFVFPVVFGTLMIGVVMLVTCQFRFGILVIASDSMVGEISKGDAVVFESYEDYGEIKENDVIVFEENNKQVVHRVVEIKTIDGQRQYITKGDANEGVDPGYRTDQQIVGVVRFKVLYIGYPSLWLRKIFVK